MKKILLYLFIVNLMPLFWPQFDPIHGHDVVTWLNMAMIQLNKAVFSPVALTSNQFESSSISD